MYKGKKGNWDLKLLLGGVSLGAIAVIFGSWVEAATEHTVDYHVESPTSRDDSSRREAEEKSQDYGTYRYEDSQGNIHTYDNGKERD